ncbi:hypothetical protein OS493_012158 [Desmophyllum pertusum]|uniref:Uncharacterized protein n=1 Tax=Desmophyllum pertusum TaxID=174260 RepID=A0A9X0A338_9CNID|nr:hypothetical protein OS493_012158 [Desmophyllum pertusum]
MFNKSSAISAVNCKMSCHIVRNVGSGLAFTFVPLAVCTMIGTRANFTATSAEFVASVGKKTIFIVQGVTCVIQTILRVHTSVSNRARELTVPYAWKTCMLPQFLVRFCDVVIYYIRRVSKSA